MPNEKILVIEDNPVIVRFNESLLSAQGYEVISATNGKEGLRMAEEECPDIIILDIILPEMHGFEVCKKLKINSKTKDIPIIIVTGSGLEGVARDEPLIKAVAYISKPYNLEDVSKAIAQAKEKIQKTGSHE